jgi:hypothetical protein
MYHTNLDRVYLSTNQPRRLPSLSDILKVLFYRLSILSVFLPPYYTCSLETLILFHSRVHVEVVSMDYNTYRLWENRDVLSIKIHVSAVKDRLIIRN